MLVPALSGISRECTIICETPMPTEDAVSMREEYSLVRGSQQGHPHEQQ
jgi:hypothetical protein